MANELEYGIKIIYKTNHKDTKWYGSKRLRDLALPHEKSNSMVKSAKPIERKKKP